MTVQGKAAAVAMKSAARREVAFKALHQTNGMQQSGA